MDDGTRGLMFEVRSFMQRRSKVTLCSTEYSVLTEWSRCGSGAGES
jgi:hypothetical protein